MMGMRTLGIVVLADEAYYIPRCDLSNRPGSSNLVPLVKQGAAQTPRMADSIDDTTREYLASQAGFESATRCLEVICL